MDIYTDPTWKYLLGQLMLAHDMVDGVRLELAVRRMHDEHAQVLSWHAQDLLEAV